MAGRWERGLKGQGPTQAEVHITMEWAKLAGESRHRSLSRAVVTCGQDTVSCPHGPTCTGILKSRSCHT